MRRNKFLISLIVVVCVIAAMSGCVISPRRIVGNGSPTPTPSPTGSPPPGVTGKLYVTDQSGNAILRFDNGLTATGNQAPAAIITGSNTTLNAPQFLALDTSADRLFVANIGAPSILVFDNISTTNANATPTRTITGPPGTLSSPSDVALDKSRDLLYVADGPEIIVFSPASTVNGTDQATKDIFVFFNSTPIQSQGIFLDAANDRLYITDPAANAIDVFDNFSTLATGNATANRNISGGSTQLARPASVALDGSGNLVVANSGNGTITVYANAATASGNPAPIATISGTSSTLIRPGQIIRNPASSSNEVYVADPSGNEVAVFSGVNAANGSVAPVRRLTDATNAQGVALDTTR